MDEDRPHRTVKPLVDARSVDPRSGKVIWSRAMHEPRKASSIDDVLAPPAIVNGKVFVGTAAGEVYALSEKTGDVLWKVDVGESISFQPAVANGRIYVGTDRGSLFWFLPGDSADDGWYMWAPTRPTTVQARADSRRARDTDIPVVRILPAAQPRLGKFSGERLNILMCSSDGCPFTGAKNIKGADYGYAGGKKWTGSITMTAPNAITGFSSRLCGRK